MPFTEAIRIAGSNLFFVSALGHQRRPARGVDRARVDAVEKHAADYVHVDDAAPAPRAWQAAELQVGLKLVA